MPVDHLFHTTNDARHPGTGLLDVLDQWRVTAWTVTSECHVPEHRAIDVDRATIERAKGAFASPSTARPVTEPGRIRLRILAMGAEKGVWGHHSP